MSSFVFGDICLGIHVSNTSHTNSRYPSFPDTSTTSSHVGIISLTDAMETEQIKTYSDTTPYPRVMAWVIRRVRFSFHAYIRSSSTARLSNGYSEVGKLQKTKQL